MAHLGSCGNRETITGESSKDLKALLLTDHMGNDEFVSPRPSMFPGAKKTICLKATDNNLLRFQGARPDHVQVASSSCCFPRELASFDPRHVTRSPPITKRIGVGRYNNTL